MLYLNTHTHTFHIELRFNLIFSCQYGAANYMRYNGIVNYLHDYFWLDIKSTLAVSICWPIWIYRGLDSFDKLKSWTSAAMQGVDEEAHRPSEGGAWQRRFWSQHQKWHLQIIWNTAFLAPPSKATFSHVTWAHRWPILLHFVDLAVKVTGRDEISWRHWEPED